MPSRKYYVYVIELSRKSFSEDKIFREANPQYNGVLQCLYVGMTSKSPKQRLIEHKTKARSKKGFKLSARLVEKYGMYLRPSIYTGMEFSTREKALEQEKILALKLRKQGYAVWYN